MSEEKYAADLAQVDLLLAERSFEKAAKILDDLAIELKDSVLSCQKMDNSHSRIACDESTSSDDYEGYESIQSAQAAWGYRKDSYSYQRLLDKVEEKIAFLIAESAKSAKNAKKA